MPQLQVPLSSDEIDQLERYAHEHSKPVEELVREYLSYLLDGGEPISAVPTDTPSSASLALMADQGGSFDWLEQEPDIYSLEDGEQV